VGSGPERYFRQVLVRPHQRRAIRREWPAFRVGRLGLARDMPATFFMKPNQSMQFLAVEDIGKFVAPSAI
jgi:hypothetical protein